MEAAFGLSVTLTMLVTSFLVILYLYIKRVAWPFIILFAVIFLTIEGMFLVANLGKVQHGGWITLLIGSILSAIMYIWYKGKQVHKKFIVQVPLQQQIQILQQLSKDREVGKYSTHLIYLSNADNENMVEKKSIDSILRSPSKKADVYWFVHINVTDEPYTMEYKVKTLAVNDVYHLTFNLGFRIEPRIDLFFRTILEELVESGGLKLEAAPDFKYSLNRTGDYKFMLGDSYLSRDNDLSQWRSILLKLYYSLKKIVVTEEENFGLETNNVLVEKYPLIVNPIEKIWLKRTIN